MSHYTARDIMHDLYKDIYSRLPHQDQAYLLIEIAKIAEHAYRRGYQQGAEHGAPYVGTGEIEKWRFDLGTGKDFETASGPPHEPGFATTSVERLEMEYTNCEARRVQALFELLREAKDGNTVSGSRT